MIKAILCFSRQWFKMPTVQNRLLLYKMIFSLSQGQSMQLIYFLYFTLQIQFQPGSSRIHRFNEIISLDYQTAYDPYQPETGVISYAWTCDQLFQQCGSLGKTNNLDPLDRIRTNRMPFSYDYNFTVTMSNKNTKFLKSITDSVVVSVQTPENSGIAPLSCINFTLQFRTATLPVTRNNANEVQVMFDNLNYTDVRLTTPQVNISSCSSLSTRTLSHIAFTDFNNPSLFSDPRTLPFNSSGITISKAKIQQTVSAQQQQVVTSYVYLFESQTNLILGYTYQRLRLRMNDVTLYAILQKSFIQVARDKILYIDGSTSFDAKNISFNYVWGVEGFNLTLPNTRVLALTPQQRTQLGINQAGRYYNYTLRVQDSNRLSDIAKIVIQISPEVDPRGCMQVDLKDIDLDKIVTFTLLPLLLQAQVTNAKCSGLEVRSLVWETSSVDYQFWAHFGNNYTITIDRNSLAGLPKNIDIQMKITQYFTVNGIEYIAVKSFTLFVEKPDLVPVVTYPRVVNIKEQQLILNATRSYDPQAVSAGTTNVPILCSWKCPDYLQAPCLRATFLQNRCLMSFLSTDIILAANYSSLIENQAHLFVLTITKDSRVNYAYIYVTIIENNRYPRCSIDFIDDISINRYANILANCTGVTSSFTYSWGAQQWNNSASISNVNEKIPTNNQILRVPPYILSSYKEVIFTLSISNGSLVTPMKLYKKINDVSGFKTGSISKNFNQFTSYLSSFSMTPANWDSSVNGNLLFQYRIKLSESSLPTFRVLLAPTQSASNKPISINLPPITFENAINVDVIDTDQNFLSVRTAIVSIPDIMMTPSTFQIRVNNIIQSIEYAFVESDFEQNILRLMLNYQALRNGHVQSSGISISFFKTIGENTVTYLLNTIVIDQRLRNVQLQDRQTLIKQHVIETLNAIAVNNRDISNAADMMNLMNQTMTGEYYLGNLMQEIFLKIYQTVFQVTDAQYSSSLIDAIIRKMIIRLQQFSFANEVLTQRLGEYQMLSYEIGADAQLMPDFDNFQYSKTAVFASKFSGGLIVFIRNSTFVHFSLHDASQNLQRIGSLSINITFQMNNAQVALNQSGNLQFFCAHKNDISASWTTIPVLAFDKGNGIVQCRSNQIGQYSLFLVDKTVRINDTTLPNNTDGGEQVINGTWNDTIRGNSTFTELSLFSQEQLTLTIVAIITLIIFLLSTYLIHLKYSDEHQTLEKKSQKFTVNQQLSLGRNRLNLYKQLMLNFNPYINLFRLYNKFLGRWVRNVFLQCFFMIISLAYGINQTLLSQHKSYIGSENSMELIGLVAIVTFGVLILRPFAIKIAFKLMYEPDAKVEDFPITTQTNQNNYIINESPVKMEQIEDYEGKKNDFTFKMPKLSSENLMQPQVTRGQDTFRVPEYEQSRLTSFREYNKGDRFETNNQLEQLHPNHTSIRTQKTLNIRMQPQPKATRISKAKKLPRHDKLISDNEESKYEQEGQSINQASFNYEDNTGKTQTQPFPSRMSFMKEKQDNSKFENDVLQNTKSELSFKLPSIIQKINHQVPMFDEIQDDDDFNAMDEQPQSSRQPGQFDMEAEDQELQRDQSFQNEGGEDEEIQEKELERAESIEEIQNTVIYPNHGSKEGALQETEFIKEGSNEDKNISQKLKDSLKSSNLSIDKSFQDQDDEPLMSEGKKYFVNKLIGKIILWLIWGGLAAGNMICVENMYAQDFYNWLILSLATFFGIIWIIDPLLYTILACLMISNQGKQRIQFFTRINRKNRKLAQFYVRSIIGIEKMRDLRRQLNPIIVSSSIS